MATDTSIYFAASYAGIPLLVASIDTETGRDVAVQSPSRGDKHVLQDRGRRHTSAKLEILFVDQPGFEPFRDRYDLFRDQVNSGEASIFVHPLDGSYRARVADMSVRASSEAREIAVSCTMLAEDEPETVFPLGAGTTPAAGLDAVTQAAAAADAALATLGKTTTATSSCVSAVTDWSTDDSLDSQKVFVEVASLTQQISDAIDTLDLASDLANWAGYQAMINLSYQIARAGEVFTSSSAQNFQITIQHPMPLLAICAQVYDASSAIDRADQVARLNRIRTPGRIPAGTMLTMPPRDS